MDYKFSDLVDIEKLQSLLDSLYEATHIAVGIADIDGTTLTRTGWTIACGEFHRNHPVLKENCIQSTNRVPELTEKAIAKNESYMCYTCDNGLIHTVAPIIIQQRYMATIYRTQFFLTEPNLENFKKQAAIMGLPEKEYIDAIKEVPIYNEQEIDKVMRFVVNIAKMLGEMGYTQLKLFQEQRIVKDNYHQLMESHEELTATYEEVAAMEEELRSQLKQIQNQERSVKESEERYRLTLKEIQESEIKIQYLSYYDNMTGLLNRTCFTDHLSNAIQVAEKHGNNGAILFVDLDNFKAINDTYGHAFGDEVLKRVAQRLEAAVRHEDCIVARFGGDEFAILKSNIEDMNQILNLTKSIKKTFDDIWIIDDHKVFLSVTIGIALFPEHGSIPEDLLKNADIAMNQAKNLGKNNYLFYKPDMKETVIKRMKMESQLRNALDNGELTLVYQPQIKINTGRIESVEALIRWNHPELGRILPGKFIPVAEETGLIIPIGEWVIYEACRQNREWQEKGYPPISVCVNISALQLEKAGFVEFVREILEDVELEPSYLELEITESKLMESKEDNIKALQRLKEIGVKIALDDFGTGYSSFNYLQHLPIHNVKIDQSFIEDITNNVNKRYIAEVIIALSHRMGLKVTAEGVETKEQLKILREYKCDRIQGFLLSKPLPIDKLEPLLKKGKLDLRNKLISGD